MSTVKMMDVSGSEVGEVELIDSLFGCTVNETAMYMGVKKYMAGLRRGTANTKGRSEINKTKKKVWRQKGTGHARQGNKRAPQWKGGGVVFGPKPRDFSLSLNKATRRDAIISALTQRAQENAVVVLHGLKLEEPKTKALVSVLKAAQVPDNALLVFSEENGEVVLSGLNLPKLGLLHFSELNAYDLLLHPTIVFTEEALKGAQEVYAS
ncbi:MAG TPA: 50S ribosomal protein L4 [Candidatus Cryosericum sp.]|nr:50S ribosomal protein L4 [Candidatus Cryosericum sp.]